MELLTNFLLLLVEGAGQLVLLLGMGGALLLQRGGQLCDPAIRLVLHLADQHGQAVLSGGNAQALEVHVAFSRIVEVDDGTAGGGLAAAGLAYQTENLALLDVEADVVHSLVDVVAAAEILLEMVNPQQHIVLLLNTGLFQALEKQRADALLDNDSRGNQHNAGQPEQHALGGDGPQQAEGRHIAGAVHVTHHIAAEGGQ